MLQVYKNYSKLILSLRKFVFDGEGGCVWEVNADCKVTFYTAGHVNSSALNLILKQIIRV
jgi:predicted metal-dependent RNase